MRNICIIIAGGLIAAAIMLTNRWEIVPMPVVTDGVSMALRVDRWTGAVRTCLTEASANELVCPK